MTTDVELGIEALRRGEATLAVERLERVCRGDPGDYRARIALGAAYGNSDRPFDALRVIEDAVRLKPRVAQGHFNLALALERAGRPALAEAALKHALLLEPYYARARSALARLRGQPPPAPEAPRSPPAAVAAPHAATPEDFGFILPPPGSSTFPTPGRAGGGPDSPAPPPAPDGFSAAVPPPPIYAPATARSIASAGLAGAGMAGVPRPSGAYIPHGMALPTGRSRPSAGWVIGLVAGLVLLGAAGIAIAATLIFPVLSHPITRDAPGLARPRFRHRPIASQSPPPEPADPRLGPLGRRLGPLGPHLAPRFAPGVLRDPSHPTAPDPGDPEDPAGG